MTIADDILTQAMDHLRNGGVVETAPFQPSNRREKSPGESLEYTYSMTQIDKVVRPFVKRGSKYVLEDTLLHPDTSFTMKEDGNFVDRITPFGVSEYYVNIFSQDYGGKVPVYINTKSFINRRLASELVNVPSALGKAVIRRFIS